MRTAAKMRCRCSRRTRWRRGSSTGSWRAGACAAAALAARLAGGLSERAQLVDDPGGDLALPPERPELAAERARLRQGAAAGRIGVLARARAAVHEQILNGRHAERVEALDLGGR